MDWVEFFEKTRVAAGVDSFSKLAPKLGISDGAISHYRTGKRVPQVWVVAECLKMQGHPQPEKAAIQIMKSEAQTSPERTFWKRLAASAMALAIGVGLASPRDVHAAMGAVDAAPSIHYAKWCLAGWSCSGCGSSLPSLPGNRTKTRLRPHVHPEGYGLEPCDMTWWSLTCNIAPEWRLMMQEARLRPTR